MLPGSRSTITIVVVLFLLFTCGLVFIVLKRKYETSKVSEKFEDGEKAEEIIKEPSKYMLDTIGCVHRQTGFKFSKEVLSQDESVEDGSTCVLTGTAMGLVPLLDGTCALEADMPDIEWKNVLSPKNCSENPECSNASKILNTTGLVPKNLASGKKCGIVFDSNVTLANLQAFDDALVLSATSLGASELLNKLVVGNRVLLEKNIDDANKIRKLNAHIVYLDETIVGLKERKAVAIASNVHLQASNAVLQTSNTLLATSNNALRQSNVILTEMIIKLDRETADANWRRAQGTVICNEHEDWWRGHSLRLGKGYHNGHWLIYNMSGIGIDGGVSVILYDGGGGYMEMGEGWHPKFTDFGWNDRVRGIHVI
jgi:hypothetical protein